MRIPGGGVGWLAAFGWILVALVISAGRAAENAFRRELATHRAAIDELDSRIVSLLNERARHAMAIGEQKRRNHQEAYAPQRERAVLERVAGLNTGPLTDATLHAVYREIMSGSLALEGPPTVAYLGPSATFTHQASLHRFGSGVEYVACASVAEVVRAVASGKVNHGVVPFENSTEGAVHPTLDALGPVVGNEGLRAIAEVRLRIVHNLATRASRLEGIRVLYVHSQTRAQCRGWIERNLPGAEVIETPSNARSAELATRNRRSAALCGDFTAQTYGLPLLVSGVQDEGEQHHPVPRAGPGPDPSDRTGSHDARDRRAIGGCRGSGIGPGSAEVGRSPSRTGACASGTRRGIGRGTATVLPRLPGARTRCGDGLRAGADPPVGRGSACSGKLSGVGGLRELRRTTAQTR